VHFDTTLPLGEPDLMRASAFQRYLDEIAPQGEGVLGHSRLSSLSPSLLLDLARFERAGQQTELLEVLAASVRHSRALAIHLQSGQRVLPLTVFPAEQLVHCPLPMPDFLDGPLTELQVMQVEPAVLRPLGDSETSLVGEPQLYHPLAPVSWELALRGAREELLPEIAGPLAYRIAPGLSLRELGLSPELQAAVVRLKRQTTNLRDISEWPGFDRVRAMRLLNALYLQAGLIVSRSHPAATNERWFGAALR